jgi:hypothetical protein
MLRVVLCCLVSVMRSVLSVSVCLCVLGGGRLVRKGIGFSKLEVMHHTVIGLIVNFWFFKRKLPFNLL